MLKSINHEGQISYCLIKKKKIKTDYKVFMEAALNNCMDGVVLQKHWIDDLSVLSSVFE